jgi:C-terminal processing protease CtpA/Prc
MKRFESIVSSKAMLAGILVMLLLLASSSYAKAEKSHEKGYLGVSVSKLSPAELKEMKLTHGIQIADVVEGDAADKAGIQEGDVIQYVDKQIIHTPGDLVVAVQKKEPGDKINIKLARGKKQITVSATLGKLNTDESFYFHPGKKKFHMHLSKKPYMGIQLRRLNDEFSEYFGRKKDEGVLVMKVMDESPAEKAGLKAGDVIIMMGTRKISIPQDIHDFMDDHKKGDNVDLTIIRHKKKITIGIELGQAGGFHTFDIFKWKSRGTHVIDIPEIHIPEFHIEIPDSEECRIIIREKLKRANEKLHRIKEKVHRKLKHIKEYIYI